MSSAAVGTHHHHSGAGPLSLMSCVRESSPLQDYEPPDIEKNAATKKKFWNPRKWFKRKNKASEDSSPVEIVEKDDFRSRSTSELSITEDQSRRRSGSSMHPGLSVSHDSVFHSPNSGSDIELDAAQSSSSLSISQPQIDLRLQTELSERLRLRRGRGDTSEDDEGLPHSPCNSPTTTETLLEKTAIKDLPTKSHSTCSDGSLHSMGSSEMDEESFSQQSRHSSKLSLQEKRSSDQDSDFELGPSSSSAPLNHSAAHHRVAVRPKRRAPHRNKKVPQLSSALPTTPEVNEESSIRSMTPENISKETFEHYSMSTKSTLTETQLKCSSLPPGLAAPGGDATKLNRSRSNAGSKSQDQFTTLEEDEREEKSDKSFFDRIFPRRSAKKRKSKEEKPPMVQTTYSKQTTESSYSKRVESKPIAAPRSGAAARQRVQPIDLPPSPEVQKREFECILPKPSPEKSFAGTSPLQAELENRFKQRLTMNASLSPPQSPKLQRSVDASVITKVEVVSKQAEVRRESKEEVRRESREEVRREVRRESKEEVRREIRRESRNEEIRSKMKIPGLSSLQQKVLSLEDEVDDTGFKSLTDLPDDDIKPGKPVTKSYSFKSVKPSLQKESENNNLVTEATNDKISVSKAASLDSIKNLEQTLTFDKKEEKEETKELKQDSSTAREEKVEETEPSISPPNSGQVADMFNDINNITISGPSHTAVVSVSSNTTNSYNTTNTQTETSGDKTKEVTTKESVSVTKIQLKRESTQITQSIVTVPKSAVPEFFNRQLNKVEAKPTSNIVFSMNSPRIIDEQSRPKSVFTIESTKNIPRKFSQEDIEIIEKSEEESLKNGSSVTMISPVMQPQPRFKKNEVSKRKTSTSSNTPESPISEKPILRSRSVSLDSLKAEGESSDKSSQDSLDKLEEKEETTEAAPKEKSTVVEPVVLRRKSLMKQKNDEEPELMKVFARRSLKLKDPEGDINLDNNDTKTRDSDKENQADSPQEERKKSITKESKALKKEEPVETREPLTESIKSPTKEQPKIKEPVNERKFIEVAEVTLRKPTNNNVYTRAFSMNPPKTEETNVKKQASFSERRITDNWISNIKNGDDLIERKISQDEIITGISPKSEFITEELISEKKNLNFNQRKAEWEKRAQEAQKKTVP